MHRLLSLLQRHTEGRYFAALSIASQGAELAYMAVIYPVGNPAVFPYQDRPGNPERYVFW
ncbi:hypothetical protein NKDENANG_01628 [Candidatus Entotheonellaceae bacterium PAL068K]